MMRFANAICQEKASDISLRHLAFPETQSHSIVKVQLFLGSEKLPNVLLQF